MKREKMKLIYWIIVIAVVCILPALYMLSSDNSDSQIQPVVAPARAEISLSGDSIVTVVDTPIEPELKRIEPKRAITGKIINAVSREPVCRYNLRVTRNDGEDALIADCEIKADNGDFSIPIEEFGELELLIESEGYDTRTYPIIVHSDEELGDHTIGLRQTFSLAVKVVDALTEKPIENAVIGTLEKRRCRPGRINENSVDLELEKESVTDEDGVCLLYRLRDVPYNVVAMHPLYKEEFVEAKPGAEQAVIKLRREGSRIFGTVCDDDGLPAKGIDISIASKEAYEERHVLTAEDGTYISPPLPQGKLLVIANSLDDDGPFTREVKWITLSEQDQEVNFGPSSEFASWQGILRFANGTVIQKAKLNLQPVKKPEVSTSIKTGYSIDVDSNGFFSMSKIPLGEYYLSYMLPRENRSRLLDNRVFKVPGKHIQNIEIPNTELCGYVNLGGSARKMPFVHVKARSYTPCSRVYSTVTDAEGFYQFKGLPPGTYMLDVDATPDYPQIAWEYPRVEVDEMIPSHLDIQLPVSGDLAYTIRGLENLEGEKYTVRLYHNEAEKSCCSLGLYRAEKIRYANERTGVVTVAEGNWTVRIYTLQDNDQYTQILEDSTYVSANETARLTLDIPSIRP